MFLTRRPAIPEAPASLMHSPSPSFEALIAAVSEAMVTGQLAGDDPAEVILFCWATVHGLAARCTSPVGSHTTTRCFDACTRAR